MQIRAPGWSRPFSSLCLARRVDMIPAVWPCQSKVNVFRGCGQDAKMITLHGDSTFCHIPLFLTLFFGFVFLDLPGTSVAKGSDYVNHSLPLAVLFFCLVLKSSCLLHLKNRRQLWEWTATLKAVILNTRKLSIGPSPTIISHSEQQLSRPYEAIWSKFPWVKESESN